MHDTLLKKNDISFEDFKNQVIEDYRIAVISRECSLLGRREVLTGKAKFGIFGDGKEVPQLAMARAFKNGDFRAGYYRDQTFMIALDLLSIEQFFSGLYANTDLEKEPMSGGRQMGGHFGTHSLNADGSWKNLTEQPNSSADISPTAAQMPRLLGLAQASKIYRHAEGIDNENFSINGNEIAWGTIGNASTSEGIFLETFNAAGVLQVPMVISIWDDEYGISVPAKYQTTKESISEALKGFQREEGIDGFEIIVAKGWDYPEIVEAYQKAETISREDHVPVLLHVTQLTQPQGHSTSGSHERYKSKERLAWEREHDCNVKMREWILENDLAPEETLKEIEKNAKREVREGKKRAWKAVGQAPKKAQQEIVDILNDLVGQSEHSSKISALKKDLENIKNVEKNQILRTARKTLWLLNHENLPSKTTLQNWIEQYKTEAQPDYSSHLYSESKWSTDFIEAVEPTFDAASEEVDGRIILRENFDKIFEDHPNSLIFGEDAGDIGDVNQGLEGLQEKYGKLRIADSGIREASILGQGIGLAMRGLRPIAEVQYLDYVLYALQTMSDDLATVHYRTKGRQKAPLIVRTRGHRLEGIWHSGSPMGGLTHLLRGIHILVPRNMTKAAGFYNTLLEGDDPALVVECLNGYRLKEKMPNNLGKFRTPIGLVETIRQGEDITIVSYGSILRIIAEAATELEKQGISVEIIDIQCLLPLDRNNDMVKSVAKTNRLLVIDEDVPGGASAYIMQHILDKQDAYQYLDSKPQTLTSKAHRPAYGSDGDYFSKPSVEDVYEKVYSIFNEFNPTKFPALF